MNKEFYRHIELDAEMQEMETLLKANDISYEFTSAKPLLDSVIVGEGLFPKYTLKLFPADFERVNQLIKALYEKKDIQIEDFPQFNEMSNEELLEILKKPDEWSIETEIVARKILNTRDFQIEEQDIQGMRNERISKMREGKKVSLFIQLLYLLAFVLGFYIHIIFIIAGIGMAYYYAFGKATDPLGNRYFIYDERARKIGKFILYIGIIVFLIQLYLMYFKT